VRDRATLEQTLVEQAQQVAQSLRRKGICGSTIKLKLRWSDFTTPTRQPTFATPTDQADVIADAAHQLLRQLWDNDQPVRLIGVGVSGLQERPQQLSLWDAPSPQDAERERRVQAAIATLRARFGDHVVRRGAPSHSPASDHDQLPNTD
jgi:DNA polymerase-4